MPLTRYHTTDNAQSTLKAGISGSTTTLIVEDGEGARFPSSFPFWVALEKHDGLQVLKRELALVTNRVGDVLTATRGAGACLPSSTSNTRGTTQYSFDVGDSITHILTPQQIEGISASVQDLETSKLNASGGLRTGLIPNRVIATNGAGEEIEVGGSPGQLLSFGPSGEIEAVSPSGATDIVGLTAKTYSSINDQHVIYDPVSGINKKQSTKALQALAYTTLYGHGLDGNVTISGTVTLTRDMQYDTLTIPVGATIRTNGFMIRAKSEIILNGTITDNGSGGGSSCALGGTGGGPGGAGENAPAVGNTYALGGGKGGDAVYAWSTSAGGLGASGTELDITTDRDISLYLPSLSNIGKFGTGGGGGGNKAGSGGNAPSGGKGAGFVGLYAPKISGTGSVTVIGEQGGDTTTVGHAAGGGGSGGIADICSPDISDITINVSGGKGGNANGGGSDHYNAGNGGKGGKIRIRSQSDLSTKIYAGGVGGTASGWNGTAGASGTLYALSM